MPASASPNATRSDFSTSGPGPADCDSPADATLSLQLLAKPHQLLTLPGNMSRLFLCFGRHSNDCQLPGIPIQVTRQTLTERGGIARIGLYPGALLIECARRNDIALRPGGFQLSIETKAKPARFINHVHRVTSP